MDTGSNDNNKPSKSPNKGWVYYKRGKKEISANENNKVAMWAIKVDTYLDGIYKCIVIIGVILTILLRATII